jgi:cytochrome P450
MHVVTAGFGMSPSEGLAFRHHMQGVVSHTATPAEQVEHGKAANVILNDVIRARQAAPKDDIISKLAEAKLREDDGSTRALTLDEINAYCRLIVFAGGGTTWRQSGITFFALMNNPDQMDAVRQDRGLLNNAVLESTRWHTTDPLFPRKAVRDTVLQGVPVAKDTVMHLCLGAANHDPTRWENPDKFDIHRPIQRSTAFAAGAHSCLGQHVARQEILVAMNAILDRLPNIRWDTSKPPAQLMGGLIGRGPGPLHVIFG